MNKLSSRFFSLIAILGLVLSSCQKEEKVKDLLIAVQLNGSDNCSLMNVATGEILLEDKLDDLTSIVVDGIALVEEDEHVYNFYNIENLEEPLNDEPFYSATGFSDNGLAIVSKKDEPLMIINEKMEVMKTLSKKINQAMPFENRDNTVVINAAGKYGVINEQGEFIVPMEYTSDGYSFYDSSHLLTKQTDRRSDVVLVNNAKDIKKHTIFGYEFIAGYGNGYYTAVKDGKVWFLDKDGKQLFHKGRLQNEDYARLCDVDANGTFAYVDGDLFGISNVKAELLVRAQYENIKPLDHGIFAVCDDGKWGIINPKGETLAKCVYEKILKVENKRYLVQKDNTYFIIDEMGQPVGANNFQYYNFGYGRGSAAATTNLFDAEGIADYIIEKEEVGSDAFGRFNSDVELSDIVEWYSDDLVLTDKNIIAYEINDNEAFGFVFSNNIIDSHYNAVDEDWMEHIKGDQNLVALVYAISLEEYKVGSEEALVKSLGEKLASLGFEKQNGKDTYINKETDSAISLGYNNGLVIFNYFFGEFASLLKEIPEEQHNPRIESK